VYCITVHQSVPVNVSCYSPKYLKWRPHFTRQRRVARRCKTLVLLPGTAWYNTKLLALVEAHWGKQLIQYSLQ
jgi:hypothetical protein